MILFKKNWDEFPSAKPDYTTKNKSFLKIAALYKKMGVENHTFMLALHNPDLEGVDPYAEDLTPAQEVAVAVESKINPWYFLREIVRVPAGEHVIPFRASRANIALAWLFYNHVTTLLIQPRQTGKTFSTSTIFMHVLYVAGKKTRIGLLTKDEKLRVETVQTIKDLALLMPKYLYLIGKKDSKNNEGISVEEHKNFYKTFLMRASKKDARDVGRGNKLEIIHIDEFAHLVNIKESMPTIITAGDAAKDIAKAANSKYYGDILTTTAARLDDPSGAFGYKYYKNCTVWAEAMYDCVDREELYEVIIKNSPIKNLQVLLDFNHRQLGYTDEWLAKKIKGANGDKITAAIDYLNEWSKGNASSPLTPEQLKVIGDSVTAPKYTQITDRGFMIRWYIPKEEVEGRLKGRSMVAGLDTSDAIGKDDIALVIRDVKTGEVLGAGTYNETNLLVFSRFILDLLEEFPKMVLIPERRSTGSGIIDNLIDMMLTIDIDPFERIFNWAVHNLDTNPNLRIELLKKLNNRSSVIYTKYRQTFGFATSGSGKTSRAGLYGNTMMSAVKYTGSTVRDSMLSSQIGGLTVRNGRIDHTENGNDDLCIGWLLSYYFLNNANNVSFYGIRPEDMLSEVIVDDLSADEISNDLHKQEQRKIKSMIMMLMNELKKDHVEPLIDAIKHKVVYFENKLDSANRESLNVVATMQQIEKDKKENNTDRAA